MQEKQKFTFLNYLKNLLLKGVKDLTIIVYLPLFIGVFAYTSFREGLEYAFEYFFIVLTFLFLIYLYAKVFVFIKYKDGSRNNWILNGIVLLILAIISYFILNLKQINYLAMMSVAVCIIVSGISYLASLLRKF